MRKVIISIAPVEANTVINMKALVKDIVNSVKAGASICHLHARTLGGQLCEDYSAMRQIFDGALEEVDFMVQASTGGISNMTIEERCLPLNYSKVESASLNGGSTNLGEEIYKNSYADIRYCGIATYHKKIIPEVEVFDIGMIHAMERLSEEGAFRKPLLYNMVFGHDGGMEANIQSLVTFQSFIPKGCLWGITHYGRNDWTFIATAIAMGASIIRIGFEDSRYLLHEKIATNNCQLVDQLRRLIKAMNLEVATPKEARELLKII